MSRVGKLPITVPDNIKVSIANGLITLDSGKAKTEYALNSKVTASFSDGKIKISAAEPKVGDSSMFVGMDRSNLSNIVKGLLSPYKTVLEVNGVGYKASVEKDLLILTLGYSHEIFYSLPAGISAAFDKPNLITISGSNKVLVGQAAAEVISFRKPEPYKGKGIKIQGQKILRKEGKKK
jgi:large subunit ribosomal protein L6